MRIKPRFTYCGLTVILSNPSRFDSIKTLPNGQQVCNLLSAGGGKLFDEFLRPEFNRHQCDIRLKECIEPLLLDTYCILLLGEMSAQIWLNNKDNTLGELRGSLYYYDGRFTQQHGISIPMIASFYPQDCADIKDYEREFNLQQDELESEDIKDSDEIDEKGRHGKTKRRNYRFWLQKDIEKCKSLIKSKGLPPKRMFEPEYIIAPNSETIISELFTAKDQKLFIDLETWIEEPYIKCIGFSFNYGRPCYVFPVYSYNNTLSYSNTYNMFKALAIGCNNNTVIAHNGAVFDFLVLAWKYGIPLGRKLEDTMIMQHRCFSDVEKSLGHLTSLWTWEPFHKDEGNVGYNTPDQMKQTMQYCGKDVYTMQLCYYAMLEYAKKIPGLIESFKMANDAIYPYLLTTLLGINVKDEMRKDIVSENDKLMMQYLRMLDILIGDKNLDTIRANGKSSLPTSNKQCCTYFHDMLGYSVVGRGKPTKDGSRNPSLAKKNLLKLRLQYDNPVIDICMAYRETQKESSTLQFTPWKE